MGKGLVPCRSAWGLPENLTQAAAPVKGSGQLGELWGAGPQSEQTKPPSG